MFKFLDNKVFYLVVSGAGLLQFFCGCSLHKTPLPQVISASPTLDEVVNAVNNNSAKVNSLVAEDGSLGVSSSPWTAKCRMAYRRDSNLRIVGNLNMVGPVVDFGSDGNIFWFWFKNQEPNQISYCKLSEYADSSMRDQIPVDPNWFPEALGVLKIDPAEVIEGPVVNRDNTIKLVLKRTRSEGDYFVYLCLESKTAAIRRIDVRSPVTNEILTVETDDSQLDPEYNVVLPKKITISRSSVKDRYFIDFGTIRVNSPDAPLAFSPPKPEELGAPLVDIGPNANTRNVSSSPVARPHNDTHTADMTGGTTALPVTDSSVSLSASREAAVTGWGTGNDTVIQPVVNDPLTVARVPSSPQRFEGISDEIPTASEPFANQTDFSLSNATLQLNTVVLPENTERNL